MTTAREQIPRSRFPFNPAAACCTGLASLVLGLMALAGYMTWWFAFIGFILDGFALIEAAAALIFGIRGLRGSYWGVAAAGLLMAAATVLKVWLFFNHPPFVEWVRANF